MTKNNKNTMIDAVNSSKTTKVYEKIKDAEPILKPFGEAEYNYDNVIDELVDIKEVVSLNLFKTITSMNKKLIDGRIKDKEAEKIRIDYLKTYINACNCFNNMVKNSANTKYSKSKLMEFINIDDAIFDDIN